MKWNEPQQRTGPELRMAGYEGDPYRLKRELRRHLEWHNSALRGCGEQDLHEGIGGTAGSTLSSHCKLKIQMFVP